MHLLILTLVAYLGAWTTVEPFVAPPCAPATHPQRAAAANEQSLLSAARAGDEAKVTALLASRVNPNAVNEDGETALMLAADASQHKVVKLLISFGADVNASSKYGFTALILSADRSDVETVKTLLAADANAKAKTRTGSTALAMALRNICTNEQYCERIQTLISALIAKGADVNAETDERETPLMVAAGTGNVDAVKLLLAHGADLRKKNSSGATAFCVASEYGFKHVAAFLQSLDPALCIKSKRRSRTMSDDSAFAALDQ